MFLGDWMCVCMCGILCAWLWMYLPDLLWVCVSQCWFATGSVANFRLVDEWSKITLFHKNLIKGSLMNNFDYFIYVKPWAEHYNLYETSWYEIFINKIYYIKLILTLLCLQNHKILTQNFPFFRKHKKRIKIDRQTN